MSSAIRLAATTAGDIAWREDGPADAPVLLLCQRFRGSIADWDPRLIDRLARTRRVIRYDMPGLGDSPDETPDSVHGIAGQVSDYTGAMGDAARHSRLNLAPLEFGRPAPPRDKIVCLRLCGADNRRRPSLSGHDPDAGPSCSQAQAGAVTWT